MASGPTAAVTEDSPAYVHASLPSASTSTTRRPVSARQRTQLRAGPRNEIQQRDEIEKELGNDAFRRGDFTVALSHYSRCIGMNPQHLLALSNRAMAYLRIKVCLCFGMYSCWNTVLLRNTLLSDCSGCGGICVNRTLVRRKRTATERCRLNQTISSRF